MLKEMLALKRAISPYAVQGQGTILTCPYAAQGLVHVLKTLNMFYHTFVIKQTYIRKNTKTFPVHNHDFMIWNDGYKKCSPIT